MPMTGKEMVRLLQRNGWQVLRINGSHHILGKQGCADRIVVPVHGNTVLKPGTESAILRQAKLK